VNVAEAPKATWRWLALSAVSVGAIA